MHLSAEDLVDLADGTRAESSASHLTSCEVCRAQLAELRAMMSAAVEAEVPEPSSLFWDQLSRGVHDAVEAERADARLKGSTARLKGSRSFGAEVFGARATGLPGARAFQASVVRLSVARAFQASVAAATLLIVALAVPRLLAPAPSPTPSSAAFQAAPPPPSVDQNNSAEAAADTGRDDVWLTFVADLAAGVDADAARDAGLDAMNADEAVMHLNDGELRELERLLQAQIRNQGN